MNDNRTRKRIVALIIGGIFVVGILPALSIILAIALDNFFRFPKLLFNPWNFIVSIPILILGFFWAIWANMDLFTKGKGSPIPTKYTQTIFLVASGPYRYCRNPMIFGTFLIFAGLGVFVNSLSLLLIITPIILILLCVYVKVREEKALEKRFGASYLEYKNSTSFIIPWFPSKGKQA